MGGSWREFRLDEVYDFRSGLSKPRSAFGAGYGFLTFKDVFYNTFTPDQLGDLVDSTARERELCSIRRGDVFLTRTSETQDELGMSCVALRDYEAATFNGFCKRLRPKNSAQIVPEYAAYFFRGPAFRRAVSAMSSLSTRASLNEEMLERLTIALPPQDTQTAIGKVLKTLDDKIELNRKMNATLEAMARALFKSWFVDFDPVRAKADGRAPSGMDAATAKLFPSEFVESELGPVPKGWSVQSLDAIADFRNGLALQKFRPNEGEPRLPVVKIAQLRTGQPDRGEWAREAIPSDCILENGDVVFSWSGSLTVVVWCGGRAALNQHLFRVTSRVNPKWFFLQWLHEHLPEFQRIAGDKATTMGHIQRHHLTAAKCVVPERSVLDAAGHVLRPLLERRVALDLESRQLARLRDELLPRLLSGALDVGPLVDGQGEL